LRDQKYFSPGILPNIYVRYCDYRLGNVIGGIITGDVQLQWFADAERKGDANVYHTTRSKNLNKNKVRKVFQVHYGKWFKK